MDALAVAQTVSVAQASEGLRYKIPPCPSVALDLLQKFNQRGVAAAIASYAPIRPELAGDFLTTLSAVTAEGDAGGLSLADVFFRTLQRLRAVTSDDLAAPYGARALVFSLLGNTGLRLCAPTKRP